MGCATVKKNMDYYDLCISDKDCAAQVTKVHDATEKAVSPFVGGNLLVEIAGALSALLTGMILGRKTATRKV